MRGGFAFPCTWAVAIIVYDDVILFDGCEGATKVTLFRKGEFPAGTRINKHKGNNRKIKVLYKK